MSTLPLRFYLAVTSEGGGESGEDGKGGEGGKIGERGCGALALPLARLPSSHWLHDGLLFAGLNLPAGQSIHSVLLSFLANFALWYVVFDI